MKKVSLGLLLAAITCFATSTFAMSVDTVTNFNGGSNPTGKFYFAMDEDTALILGGEANIATGMRATPAETTVDVIAGIKSKMPIVGTVDLYGVFGTGDSATSTDRNLLRSVVISKTWMSKLTDKVKIGLSIPLIKVNTAGGNSVEILSQINPEIGMTLDF